MKRIFGIRLTLAFSFLFAITVVIGARQSVRTLRTAEIEGASLALDEKVEIVGKYRELIDDRLYLVDCPVPFVLENPALFAELVQFTAKNTNLAVLGSVGARDGTLVIVTERIREASNDQELFEAELNELVSEATGDTREKAYELARRIVRATEMQRDDTLLPLAVSAFRFALAGGEKTETLTTAELSERTKKILQVHETLKDDGLARDLLVSLLNHVPDTAAVHTLLKDLNCRQYLGQWVTYREFKTQEGLVEYRGKWVTTREKHFSTTMEKFDNHDTSNLRLLRRRTEKEYLLMAERGKVEIGMSREEVCLAFGFPDYVLRRSNQGKEFDQWAFGSKYYYFFDGILVHAGA